jgi:hypothetical protein
MGAETETDWLTILGFVCVALFLGCTPLGQAITSIWNAEQEKDYEKQRKFNAERAEQGNPTACTASSCCPPPQLTTSPHAHALPFLRQGVERISQEGGCLPTGQTLLRLPLRKRCEQAPQRAALHRQWQRLGPVHQVFDVPEHPGVIDARRL